MVVEDLFNAPDPYQYFEQYSQGDNYFEEVLDTLFFNETIGENDILQILNATDINNDSFISRREMYAKFEENRKGLVRYFKEELGKVVRQLNFASYHPTTI